jgi:hypothetical protein
MMMRCVKCDKPLAASQRYIMRRDDILYGEYVFQHYNCDDPCRARQEGRGYE